MGKIININFSVELCMNKIKQKIYLFTDGSVNPQSGAGFGAYLFLEKLDIFSPELEKQIKIKKFENTSSTKLPHQPLFLLGYFLKRTLLYRR